MKTIGFDPLLWWVDLVIVMDRDELWQQSAEHHLIPPIDGPGRVQPKEFIVGLAQCLHRAMPMPPEMMRPFYSWDPVWDRAIALFLNHAVTHLSETDEETARHISSLAGLSMGQVNGIA